MTRKPCSLGMALPKTVVLSGKSEARLLIREVQQGDAPLLADFYHSLSWKSRLFFHPYISTGIQHMRCVVENSITCLQKDLIALTEEGQIVGHGFLWGIQGKVPELGLGIADRYQNLGLGHVFMELLIGYARDVLGKERIRLSVYKRNMRARHLYDKFGFQVIEQHRTPRWTILGFPLPMVALKMELEIEKGGCHDRVGVGLGC